MIIDVILYGFVGYIVVGWLAYFLMNRSYVVWMNKNINVYCKVKNKPSFNYKTTRKFISIFWPFFMLINLGLTKNKVEQTLNNFAKGYKNV